MSRECLHTCIDVVWIFYERDLSRLIAADITTCTNHLHDYDYLRACLWNEVRIAYPRELQRGGFAKEFNIGQYYKYTASNI